MIPINSIEQMTPKQIHIAVEAEMINAPIAIDGLILKKGSLLRAIAELKDIDADSDDISEAVKINLQWAEHSVAMIQRAIDTLNKHVEPVKVFDRPSMASINRLLDSVTNSK